MKLINVKNSDKGMLTKLMTECGVTSLTAAALVSRGYSSSEEVFSKLQTDELSDPFLIKDMQVAADTINNAIDEGLRICIYGDYDCDGIMATAILYSFMLEAGADVMYYIPERSEGYGLNMNSVDKLADEGINLIVTVDNGISAIAEAEHIYERGMKLVVTDHHQQGEFLPKAEAVVDPHRHDCFSPFKFSCGAVIALKLVAAMDGGDYTMALEQFGDLAAIATVADIVSLTGENRFIVSYGLERINNTDRPALIALKQVSGIAEKKIDSRSIGFTLSPRINASGRFGSPSTALQLFLSEDEQDAMNIALELDRLNSERKIEENKIISEIYEMIDSNPMLLRGRTIILCGKNWHHGVIGIVASRILEQFGKPCFIVSEDNGEMRGSARSFGEFSVFSALNSASESLVKFGGHPGAGGFTIKNGEIDRFIQLVERYAFEMHREMPVYTITADSVINASDITLKNIEGLKVLEPFGEDNEKPVFYIENAHINDKIPVSDGAHTKLKFRLEGMNFEAMMFRTSPYNVPVRAGDYCDMIVSLDINEFRGNVNPSIIISELRPHSFEQNKYFAAFSAFETFLRNEELPQNYYPVMYPSREDVIKIYRNIPDEGINSDTLYLSVSDGRINYCRFLTSVEALRQLGLVRVTSADSKITKIQVSGKADLDSAPVLISLRGKIPQRKI